MKPTRMGLIDVYRDELSRHCEDLKNLITQDYYRRSSLLDDVGKAHEDGLRLLADAEVGRIIDAAGAAGSCCPRCGNCRGPAAAVDDEGASHD